MSRIVVLLLLAVHSKAVRQEVSDFLSALAVVDSNANEYIKIDTQQKFNGPLFEDFKTNHATYKKLDDLLAFYNPDADEREIYTPTKDSAIFSFVEAIMATDVMKSAHQFLAERGLASPDSEMFKRELTALWFTAYARGPSVGSSGFEALFAGEVQNGRVIRFANWYRLAQLEKQGLINYFRQEQTNAQLLLNFKWANWEADGISVLLNTSPEFEMAVYTVCALTDHDCQFTKDGAKIGLTATTLENGGSITINLCRPYAVNEEASSFEGNKKTRKPQDFAELVKLVNKMRDEDVDKPCPGDYKLDYGNKVSGSSDVSENNLIVYVNETLFKRPVYKTLIDLVERKIFVNDVCENEKSMRGLRKVQIRLLFDTWTDTKVFKLAYEFLHTKGESHAASFEEFKKFLFNFWFGTYSRCGGTLGSSGFEHVFTGEWKKGTVGGHHSWVTYYVAQKKGNINYHGYYSYLPEDSGTLTGTFQYKWGNMFKKTGGFLFGTSPAFDFSLFTVCSLMYKGDHGCRYQIDGVPMGVTSYTQPCGSELCLATAYPLH